MRKRSKVAPMRSSPRHVWRVAYQVASGCVERCDRCGGSFHPGLDGYGPVYCAPSPDWLRAHPDDDRGER